MADAWSNLRYVPPPISTPTKRPSFWKPSQPGTEGTDHSWMTSGPARATETRRTTGVPSVRTPPTAANEAVLSDAHADTARSACKAYLVEVCRSTGTASGRAPRSIVSLVVSQSELGTRDSGEQAATTAVPIQIPAETAMRGGKWRDTQPQGVDSDTGTLSAICACAQHLGIEHDNRVLLPDTSVQYGRSHCRGERFSDIYTRYAERSSAVDTGRSDGDDGTGDRASGVADDSGLTQPRNGF